ncbi:MAG: hypothetical protein ACR2NU_03750 [Aeoliella sp.]
MMSQQLNNAIVEICFGHARYGETDAVRIPDPLFRFLTYEGWYVIVSNLIKGFAPRKNNHARSGRFLQRQRPACHHLGGANLTASVLRPGVQKQPPRAAGARR